jgi:hypothetical protein
MANHFCAKHTHSTGMEEVMDPALDAYRLIHPAFDYIREGWQQAMRMIDKQMLDVDYPVVDDRKAKYALLSVETDETGVMSRCCLC